MPGPFSVQAIRGECRGSSATTVSSVSARLLQRVELAAGAAQRRESGET
jgi:hypothetical protein